MGANDPPDMNEVGMKATEDARPIHRVYVDFFMDKNDVTNGPLAAAFECAIRGARGVCEREARIHVDEAPEDPLAGVGCRNAPEHLLAFLEASRDGAQAGAMSYAGRRKG